MIDLYDQINREISGGGDVVLATIVDQQGSAPRTTGTHFLVRPDGSFSGTIGGGRLEAEVVKAVPRVLHVEAAALGVVGPGRHCVAPHP